MVSLAIYSSPKAPPPSAPDLSSSKILPGETPLEHLKRLTSNMSKPSTPTVLKEDETPSDAAIDSTLRNETSTDVALASMAPVAGTTYVF